MSEQRTRILGAAAELFLAEGVEQVSVERVATKARVSKTAIYEQFGGKKKLFDAVISYACAETGAPALEPLDDDFDLRDTLIGVGRNTARWLLKPDALRILRASMGAYHDNPKAAKLLWEHGPVRVTHQVAEALSREKKRRRLRKLDPHEVSLEFANEVVGPFLLTSMLGVTPNPTKREIDKKVERVVDDLLERYELA